MPRRVSDGDGPPSSRAFRSDREGLARVLGELEAAIMEYLWSHRPAGCSARDVHQAVGIPRGNHYLTILTVLNKLVAKRLLRREKHGRAFSFVPALTREAFLRDVSRELLGGMLQLAPDIAVTSFVDLLSEVDPDVLGRLDREIARRRPKRRRRQ